MDDIGHAAIDLIRSYSKSWLLLNAFDENRLTYNNKNIVYHENFTEDFCTANILSFKQDLMSQQEASELFGNQREHGLSQILGSIHQTFAGELLSNLSMNEQLICFISHSRSSFCRWE